MIGAKMQQREARGKALMFGIVVAALMAACMLLGAKPAHAQFFVLFTVNSTGDEPDASAGNNLCATSGGACTLRAAIQEANANGTTAVDFIDFGIPGSGVKTISPSTPLPTIAEPVIIDGYTQPGATPNTKAVGDNAVVLIRLDGLNLPSGGDSIGLRITAANSVVRGLSITRFPGGYAIGLVGADNNTIEGNFVGITPDGQAGGNAGDAVVISIGASGNTVGGTSPPARNIISGNGSSFISIADGVVIHDSGTTANKVMGNYIGTTKSGTGNLGNTGQGIVIRVSGNLIGDNDRSDGLTNAANIIAFNGLDGVNVSGGTTSVRNAITRNSIFSNARLGIDLDPPEGVTPNDGVGDADTGPNTLQNFPVISSARSGGGKATIKGTLESTQSGTFTIQFFSNPKGARDEGKKFVGETIVNDADGDGIMSFNTKSALKVKAGLFVTATATDGTGNTSEFSTPKKVGG
jgi:CSLREA domain-containing protein